MEKAIENHTQLKSTLQEKQAQLQNHKLKHQEIIGNQAMIEAVCDKATQLLNQTQDTSLNEYPQSIKTLFHNIVAKSKVSTLCVYSFYETRVRFPAGQKNYNNANYSFRDWL